MDTDIAWQSLEADIRAAAGVHLQDVWLFDVYTGERLPTGTRSLAFAMVFQNHDATLEDEQIKKAVDKVVAVLDDKHGAKLRD